MKPFAVPSKRRAQPRVAAAGTYPATLVQIVEISPGQFEAKWRLRAPVATDPEKPVGQFTLLQLMDAAELGDTLIDLGEKPGAAVDFADLVGRKAQVVVRTFAGRRYSRVVDVKPVDQGG